MKKLLLLVLFCSPVLSYSQDTSNQKLMGIVPYENLSVRYKGVVEVPGVAADEIYNRAKRWVATYYRSSTDAVKLDNKEAGELLVKGYLLMDFKAPLYPNPWHAYNVLLIQIKDGKYRYELQVPSITTTSTLSDEQTPTYYVRHLSEKNGKKMLMSLDKTCNRSIEELNSAVKSNSNSNW